MSIVEAFSVGTPVVCADLGNAGVTGRKFRADLPQSLICAVESCGGLCQSTYDAYLARYTAQENYGSLLQIYAAARPTNG